MAGGGGRMQEAKLVQNTLWRVSHQNESENEAALQPGLSQWRGFHEKCDKNKKGCHVLILARRPASC